MKMTSLCRCVGICALVTLQGQALSENAASSMPIPEPEPMVTYLVPLEDLLLPGAEPDAQGALGAVVVKVEGSARVFLEPASPETIALEQGQVLGPGARVQTGFGKVVLKLGEGQLFVVREMSDVTIDEARREGRKDTTTLFIEAGTVSFDVTSTEFANDVQLKAPDATLAVKGTDGSMQVRGGFPTRAWGGEFNTGEINVSYWNGRLAKFRDDSTTDAQNADPLSNAIAKTALNIGATDERESDEDAVVDRSSGGGQAVRRVVGAPNPFAAEQISGFTDPPSPPGGGGNGGGGNGGGDPDPTPSPTTPTPPTPINPLPPTTPTLEPPTPPTPGPVIPPAFDNDAPSAPTNPAPPTPDFGAGPTHPTPSVVPSNNASFPLGGPEVDVPQIDADLMRRIERIACQSADHAACRAAIARDAGRINALLTKGVTPERAVRGIDACTCAAKSAKAAETKKKAGRR